MHLGEGAGAPSSYTRAPVELHTGPRHARGLTSSSRCGRRRLQPHPHLHPHLRQRVIRCPRACACAGCGGRERAAARRAAEAAAAAARDAAKCALQQQLDQVWPPPPSPTPTFTPTFAGASSPDLVDPVARCGKPCRGLSSGGAGGVLCVGGVGSGVHPYLIHRLQEGARGSEGARGRRCSGPMLGRGWWLAVRSQQSVPQRIRRSARQRCG